MNSHWTWLQAAFPGQILAMAFLLLGALICRTVQARNPASHARRQASHVAIGLFAVCLATILGSVLLEVVAYPMHQGFLVLNGSGQEAVLMLDGDAALVLPPHSHGRVARRGWRRNTKATLRAAGSTHDLGTLEPGLYAVNASADTWIQGGVEGRTPVEAVLRNRFALESATPCLEGPGSRRLSERLSDSVVDFGGTEILGRDGHAKGSVTLGAAWGWRKAPRELNPLPLREGHPWLSLLILVGPAFLGAWALWRIQVLRRRQTMGLGDLP